MENGILIFGVPFSFFVVKCISDTIFLKKDLVTDFRQTKKQSLS